MSQPQSPPVSEPFQALVRTITQALAGRAVDASLEAWLNEEWGAQSSWYRLMKAECERGVREGWLCTREAGGIRYGRVLPPSPQTAGFSVDVVDMHDVVGPHHVHPTGELDLVMPLTPQAQFDGTPAGWKVYGPGTAHRPTVTQGRALVLYLLPEGRIEFTRA